MNVPLQGLLVRLRDRLLLTLDLRDLVAERERQFTRELERMRAGRARHPDDRPYSCREIARRQKECVRHLERMRQAQEGLGDWPAAETPAVARLRARYQRA